MLLSILYDCLFSALAAMGFAIISNPPKKAIFVAALLSAIGHGFRFFLINGLSMEIVSATAIASFTIGVLSLFFARWIHCPAEVFSFPSLLPMIPGQYAYKTILCVMQFLWVRDDERSQILVAEMFRNGLTTIFIMFALVVGVSFSMLREESMMMTRGGKG